MEIISKYGNNYFHSELHNQLFYLHPIINYFLNLENEGSDIKKIKSHLITKKCKFLEKISSAKIKYYHRKYELLKSNNIFKEMNEIEKLPLYVNADSVKFNLANTPKITFEVTDSCNLYCRYCGFGKYYSNYDRRANKNLSITVGKKIFDYLVSLWNSSLNSSCNQEIYIGFYGGEPLLNFPFIREIVKYAKPDKLKRNKLAFAMTTNGILLDRYIDFLVKYNFNLLISLDGNEKNNCYRVYRNGEPSFEKIYTNIILLKDKYPDFFEKNVHFNSILHNKNSVSDIVDFFWRNFKKVPNISGLALVGLNPELKGEFLEMYRNNRENWKEVGSRENIEKIMFSKIPENKDLIDFYRFFSGYEYKKYRNLNNLDDGKLHATTGTCFPFTKKIFITVNGKILPCERIGHQYAFGYVNEDEIELNFENIAQVYNKYFAKLKKKCKRCHLYYRACTQCIFNLKFGKSDFECNEFMNHKDIKQWFSDQISYLEERPELYLRILRENYGE